jgi:hypothetical protein
MDGRMGPNWAPLRDSNTSIYSLNEANEVWKRIEAFKARGMAKRGSEGMAERG